MILAVLPFAAGCKAGEGTDGPRSASPPAPCPAAWLQPPVVDPAIAIPDGGAAAVAHALAKGTQNYTCKHSGDAADGGFAWTLAGPEAVLSDCTAAVMGQHFASDAGAAAPEWQTTGGDYVVGHKVAAYAPDKSAVPWLLLATDHAGGSGPIAGTKYVQRVSTTGGVAPSAQCDANTVGITQKVPYSADYYFFGP
jgi:hypothetical protein